MNSKKVEAILRNITLPQKLQGTVGGKRMGFPHITIYKNITRRLGKNFLLNLTSLDFGDENYE